MQWLTHIRNRIGNFLLKRELHKYPAKRKFISLQDAREIGIIYNGENKDKEALVHQYANQLRSEGKKVFLMGYIDSKTLPGNKQFSLQSEYCWREKLTPFNLPDKNKIGRFLEIPFDLLISIYNETEKPLLPILALAGYSHAKYKAGPAVTDGTAYYDSIIDTGTNKDIHFLIQQIDFYLRVIK